MKRTIGVALCVLGVLLAVFGIIWITVIWPGLARIPADLNQETIQQGTVTLYDAQHDAYVTNDVTNSRHYVAVKASKDIVYLNETVTFTDTATGQEMPSVRANYLLAVDRVTRKNVPGHGDGDRDGNYSFPFNVSKTETYPFWNEGNPENLDCKYVDETDYEGMHVYIFEMATPEGGLITPAGFLPPDLQIYQPEMRIDQNIRLYVEPISGVTVYFESTSKRSGRIPVPDELFPATGPLTYKDVTFYEDSLKFADETVADLVSQAKSTKTQVTFAKNVLPWLSIGGGILLVGVGIFLSGMVGFLFPGERGGAVHSAKHLLILAVVPTLLMMAILPAVLGDGGVKAISSVAGNSYQAVNDIPLPKLSEAAAQSSPNPAPSQTDNSTAPVTSSGAVKASFTVVSRPVNDQAASEAATAATGVARDPNSTSASASQRVVSNVAANDRPVPSDQLGTQAGVRPKSGGLTMGWVLLITAWSVEIALVCGLAFIRGRAGSQVLELKTSGRFWLKP
jgi:hypothetical protein